MKKTTDHLASRFEEVLLNGTWIANTNYQALLSDVSREQATRRVGDLNTIAALTWHVNYYIAGILQVFRGGALEIRDRYSFDMPPVESDEDWARMREELFSNAAEFAAHVARIPEETLDSPFVEEKYGTWRRNIEGMIVHAYYHLGQIALIKKMTR